MIKYVNLLSTTHVKTFQKFIESFYIFRIKTEHNTREYFVQYRIAKS